MKVEQLAKFKEKQEEDKAAARLHSFKYRLSFLVYMFLFMTKPTCYTVVYICILCYSSLLLFLYWFSGSCSSSNSAPTSSSKSGRMISLKSVSLGTKVVLLRSLILVCFMSWFWMSPEFKRSEQG